MGGVYASIGDNHAGPRLYYPLRGAGLLHFTIYQEERKYGRRWLEKLDRCFVVDEEVTDEAENIDCIAGSNNINGS